LQARQIIPKPGASFRNLSHEVESLLDSSLENVTCITEKVINGELKTF
jgi:S-adenosylmethionine synthetase